MVRLNEVPVAETKRHQLGVHSNTRWAAAVVRLSDPAAFARTDQFSLAKESQDTAIQESQKIQSQFQTIMTKTAELAAKGHPGAKMVIEELRNAVSDWLQSKVRSKSRSPNPPRNPISKR